MIDPNRKAARSLGRVAVTRADRLDQGDLLAGLPPTLQHRLQQLHRPFDLQVLKGKKRPQSTQPGRGTLMSPPCSRSATYRSMGNSNASERCSA